MGSGLSTAETIPSSAASVTWALLPPLKASFKEEGEKTVSLAAVFWEAPFRMEGQEESK